NCIPIGRTMPIGPKPLGKKCSKPFSIVWKRQPTINGQERKFINKKEIKNHDNRKSIDRGSECGTHVQRTGKASLEGADRCRRNAAMVFRPKGIRPQSRL